MGVSLATLLQIIELGSRIAPPKSPVMLGRQAFRHKPRQEKSVRRALARHEKFQGLTADDLVSEDGYSEKMFRTLGFGEVQTMDFSPYEGAQILHDLNKPLPKALKGSFDFVYDGGTTEHVFDVAQCFRNMFDMLAVGGTLISATPFNGWPGHGFYQFQPDLVWSFWRYMAGCEVVKCLALPYDAGVAPLDLPDNKGSKRRREYDNALPPGRVFLYYEVRKPAGAKLTGMALQADYETKWQETAKENE